jgi:dihydrofolate reductase
MLAPYWSSLKNDEMGIAAKLNSAPKHVVTTTLRELDWHFSSIIGDDVVHTIGELKTRYPKQILIDGSATLVRSLMNTGLIDEYRLLLHPIVLGGGEHYFREDPKESLELREVEQSDAGVVLLRYLPQAATTTS